MSAITPSKVAILSSDNDASAPGRNWRGKPHQYTPEQRQRLTEDTEGLLLLDAGRRGNTPPQLQLEALSNEELQQLFWLLIRAVPPSKV